MRSKIEARLNGGGKVENANSFNKKFHTPTKLLIQRVKEKGRRKREGAKKKKKEKKNEKSKGFIFRHSFVIYFVERRSTLH